MPYIARDFTTLEEPCGSDPGVIITSSSVHAASQSQDRVLFGTPHKRHSQQFASYLYQNPEEQRLSEVLVEVGFSNEKNSR